MLIVEVKGDEQSPLVAPHIQDYLVVYHETGLANDGPLLPPHDEDRLCHD